MNTPKTKIYSVHVHVSKWTPPPPKPNQDLHVYVSKWTSPHPNPDLHVYVSKLTHPNPNPDLHVYVSKLTHPHPNPDLHVYVSTWPQPIWDHVFPLLVLFDLWWPLHLLFLIPQDGLVGLGRVRPALLQGQLSLLGRGTGLGFMMLHEAASHPEDILEDD